MFRQLFTKYLGSNSKHALNLNEFIKEVISIRHYKACKMTKTLFFLIKFKKDEKEVKVKCDQNCRNILFKV